VVTFDQDAGKFTLSQPAPPIAGLPTYELHAMLSPKDLNDCINRALGRCAYLAQQVITPLGTQRQYSLAAYTDIIDEGQIQHLFWREGSTVDDYSYVSIPFRVLRNGTTISLHVDIDAFSVGTSASMVLSYRAFYPELATDASTTNCPEEWARKGAIVEAYNLLINKGTAQDLTVYERRRAESASRFTQLTRAFSPRRVVRIALENDPVTVYP
jgi:hypothetical protein